MKKILCFLLICCCLLFSLTACNTNSSSTATDGNTNSSSTATDGNTNSSSTATDGNTPAHVVENFLDALKQQNYAAVKPHYAEDLDNIPQFKNKVESISPLIANKLFEKIADFNYQIGKTTINPDDPNKATVTVTIQAYDLGKAFEGLVLDFLKTDLEMSFDGATDDDIMKEAESKLAPAIDNSKRSISQTVDIPLTKENDNWQVDSIKDNMPLLNILTGNIINTIEKLANILNSLS